MRVDRILDPDNNEDDRAIVVWATTLGVPIQRRPFETECWVDWLYDNDLQDFEKIWNNVWHHGQHFRFPPTK